MPHAVTRIRRLEAQGAALPATVAPSGARRVILEAALRLFAERGFAAASIRDIAAEAKIKSATLYAHYPSKEHVLAELIEIAHREHHRLLRAALLDSEPDARRQLAAIVRVHVGMHAEYAMLALVANAELHALSPALAAASFELRRESEQLLHDVVSRGIEQRVFEMPHAWLAVAAIGGMGMRVANWFTSDFELGVEEVASVYATFALRIVGAKEERSAS